MGLVLTIASVAAMGLLGLWGLGRGVQRGLLSLVGTLLAVVLVDLWREAWGDWLRQQFRPENPADLTLFAVALVFVGVALVLGYGSSLLIARPKGRKPQPLSLNDRLIGGLLGALNGALIVSYLLHYTAGLKSDFAATLASEPLLGLLHAWLPWFVLALVLAAIIGIALRATIRISQLAARSAATSSPPPAAAQVAGATTQSERLQAVSNKIDQKIGEPPKK